MTRDRRISELEREAAQPGRFDRELVEAYKGANPRRETSFSDWVNLFKKSGRRPAEEEDSWSKDLNRLMKDLGYSSIPPNEAARPNVRKDALETISRLNALAEPYRKIRSEYEEEQLKKWNEGRGDFERLPERNMMTSHPGEIEKYRKGILRGEIPGGEKFTMPPLRIEGDLSTLPTPAPNIYRPFPTETLDPDTFMKGDDPGKPVYRKKLKQYPKPSKDKELKKPGDAGFDWRSLIPDIDLDFDFDLEWDEIGSNFGKGLAALGDAFMAGGGMKSSFLQNISKAQQRRDKQPFERFKVFSKLLQSEINQDLINAYRMAGLTQKGAQFEARLEQDEKELKFRRNNSIRNYNVALEKIRDQAKFRLLTYGTAKEKLDLQKKTLALKTLDKAENTQTNILKRNKIKLEIEELVLGKEKNVKGGPLVQALRPMIANDESHQMFPKWLHVQNRSARKINEYTAAQIEEIGKEHRKNLGKKAGKKASATSEQLLARHSNNSESAAILKDAFGPNWRNQSPEALSGIDKFVDNSKKEMNTLAKREAVPVKYAQDIITSTNKILKLIGEEAGDPALTRDQLEVNKGSGKIFYIPRDEDGRLDRSSRKEVDLDGVQLPGGVSLTSTLDIFGTNTASALEQLYEGIYAPKRRQDFGASQSFRELERYAIGVGKEIGFVKREGGMLGYILGMSDRAQQGLSKYALEMSGKNGGRHRLSLDGFDYNSYFNPETKMFTPQFSSPEKAAAVATKMYRENGDRATGTINPKFMPGWYRYMKKAINRNHNNGVTIYYHYPRIEKTTPGGEKITEESTSSRKGTFSREPYGTGAKPVEWNDEVWIKFIEQYGVNPKNWDF
jgi:hypothetical protein